LTLHAQGPIRARHPVQTVIKAENLAANLDAAPSRESGFVRWRKAAVRPRTNDVRTIPESGRDSLSTAEAI